MTARDLLALRRLAIDCVVGVYPHERDTQQPLVLDVEMWLDTEDAGRSERLSRTVDYDAVASELRFLLQHCRFGLLETAAHALARYLLAPPVPGSRRARIERVRLTLEKPQALGGAAIPSLTVERDSADAGAYACEEKPFGTVDVIAETSDAGIYRLNLQPGGVIPLHVHRMMREAEMVLGDGMLCQGEPAPAGTVRRWPHDTPHEYRNPTTAVQTILCVDSPSFLPDDEIPVTGAPARVEPDPTFRARRA